MIELVHLDYKENFTLDWKITKYANENLEEICEVPEEKWEDDLC